jgi:hypothetical protein
MTDAADATPAEVDLASASPARIAELAAPAIDRVFITAMHAARDAGGRDLVMRYGRAAAPLVDLRNPLAAGRTVGPAVADGPYRYQNREQVLAALRNSANHGFLTPQQGGEYVVAATGREFLTELYDLHSAVLAERWESSHGVRVARLNAFVQRLLDAAAATGGTGWAVFAPPHEPAGAPPGLLLLNRLSTLRAHRADSHAAAWRAAGLTVQQIVAMPVGPERDAIELETNARAGVPYQALAADERIVLLADLAALP